MQKAKKIGEIAEFKMNLNYDISTYEFLDLDLEIATRHLSQKDQEVLILYLMGHTHDDIAKYKDVSRSTISKRLKRITSKLTILMS